MYDDPHPAGWPNAAPVEPLFSRLATRQALIRLGHGGEDDVSADPELGMTLGDVTPAQLRQRDAATIRVGRLPHLMIVPTGLAAPQSALGDVSVSAFEVGTPIRRGLWPRDSGLPSDTARYVVALGELPESYFALSDEP